MKKLFSFLLASLFLAACTSATIDPLEGRKTTIIPFETVQGPQKLTAYVAQSNKERAQGLMFVKSLPKNHGMIFLDDKMAQPNFWMKNMQISLDFVYLDDEGKVVDVLENIPPCTAKNDEDCELYHPQVPAKDVLEIPAGWVKEVGLKVGDAFELKSLENKNI